jgi:hypothetical protein
MFFADFITLWVDKRNKFHPPTQETTPACCNTLRRASTALAVEECVKARDRNATIDVSRFGGFRSSADDPPTCSPKKFFGRREPWHRWVWFWGTTPACRNTSTKRFGKGRHFGVQARACPWGSIFQRIRM